MLFSACLLVYDLPNLNVNNEEAFLSKVPKSNRVLIVTPSEPLDKMRNDICSVRGGYENMPFLKLNTLSQFYL